MTAEDIKIMRIKALPKRKLKKKKKQEKQKIVKQNTFWIVNIGWKKLHADDLIDFDEDCGL